MNTTHPNAYARFTEIDGIRGWASLCVLLFHLSWELFGVQYPEIRNPLSRALLDGNLAVFIFFILSGDALSVGFTQPTGKGLSAKMVVKRYFRLTGPILFSCGLVFLLMRFNLTYHLQAAALVHREDWLGSFLPFTASFVKMLKYSLIGCYTEHALTNTYNPFLWTMSIEFCGSLLVFSIGFVYQQLRTPLAVCASCATLLFMLGSLYALFFIGICFGIVRAQGGFTKLQNLPYNRGYTGFGVLLLLVINAYKTSIPLLPPYQKDILLAMTGVLLCYASADLLALMRNRLSGFLGRISFPLYYMQFPVLISFTAFSLGYAQHHFNYPPLVPISVVLTSLLVMLPIASITEKLEAGYLKRVDKFVQRLLH